MARTVLYGDLDVPQLLAFVSEINMHLVIRSCNVTAEAALKLQKE
jgi:hypothetical protein